LWPRQRWAFERHLILDGGELQRLVDRGSLVHYRHPEISARCAGDRFVGRVVLCEAIGRIGDILEKSGFRGVAGGLVSISPVAKL